MISLISLTHRCFGFGQQYRDPTYKIDINAEYIIELIEQISISFAFQSIFR